MLGQEGDDLGLMIGRPGVGLGDLLLDDPQQIGMGGREGTVSQINGTTPY